MAHRSAVESEIVNRVTGKRFCLDHQKYVSSDMGSLVTVRDRTRWICFNCQERKKSRAGRKL